MCIITGYCLLPITRSLTAVSVSLSPTLSHWSENQPKNQVALAMRFVVLVLAYLLGAAHARPVAPDADTVYFPDQVDYLRVAMGKCKEPLVYWPGNGRCYEPNTQGPCSIEDLLVQSVKHFQPQCKRAIDIHYR